MRPKLLFIYLLVFGSFLQSIQGLSCSGGTPIENAGGTACIASCWTNDDNRYVNSAGTKCVDSCPTGTCYDQSTHACVACSTNCDDCYLEGGSNKYCRKCSTGYYLKSDYTGCVADCTSDTATTGYGTKIGAATGNSQNGDFICVGNCYLYDQSFTSSDYKTCVSACAENEGVDFQTNADFAVCTACTAGCKVCSFAVADATETCQECVSPKLLQGTACVDGCTAGTDWKDPTGKFCTGLNCNSLDINYVLNNDADECILASNCPADHAIGIKNPTDATNSFIYQCQTCSVTLTNCIACEWLASNTLSCTKCSSGYSVTWNSKGECTATASGVCGSDYWLEKTNSLKCVGNCYLEDNGKYRSSVGGGLYECVEACESDEFLDSSNPMNPLCNKCASLPLTSDQFKVAGNSGECATCSLDGTVCFTCATGYLRSDKAECVGNCQNEVVPAFLNANATMCLKACRSENEIRSSPTAYTCVTECASGSYNNDGVCTPCTTTYGTDCLTCTVDGCLTCGSSKIMRQDKMGCVTDCVAEDSSGIGFGTNFLNAAGTACVHDCLTEDSNRVLNFLRTQCADSCASGEFFDYGKNVVSSATHAPSCYKCNEMLLATYADLGADKLAHCATCSSLTVCLTCENGYLLRVDKTECIDNCKTENIAYARDVNGVNCVSVCAAGEYFDVSDQSNTDNYCKSACATAGTYYDVTDDQCKSCQNSTTIITNNIADCSECAQGKCTKCATKKLESDGSGCLDTCSSGKAGPDRICVSDCHSHNPLYYEASDGASCVTACSVGSIDFLSEYINFATYKCTSDCSTLTNCDTCADANICTSCSSGYLKVDTATSKVVCVADCRTDSLFLNNAGNACVTSCYDDDNQRYGNEGASENNCVDSCASGTYQTIDNKCLPCAEGTAEFQYCTECKEVGTVTTQKSCTSCSAKFLEITGTLGCVDTCTTGKQSATTHNCVASCSGEGSYLNDADDNKCVTSCTLDGVCGGATDACDCIENCNTNQYYDSATFTCKVCSVMADCETCTASNVCTSCGNNKYLKSDATGCVVSCRNDLVGGVHTLQTTTKVRHCVVACSSDDAPTQNKGSDGLTCVENCLSDEYLDGSECKKCFTAMAGCLTCDSDSVCTQCQTGYVYHDGTNQNTCVAACTAGANYLSVDGKICYTDCANNLVSTARTYLNVLGTQCVVSCATNDHSFLSNEAVTGGEIVCVTEDVCINHANKLYTDAGECKKCEDVGADYADCKVCKKVGTDVLCYECTTTYIKANGKGCIASCATEGSYQYQGTGLKRCVNHCYSEDFENGATYLDFPLATKACKSQGTACLADEFVYQDGTTDYICYQCKTNPIKDADPSLADMSRCKTCTAYNVCTECETAGILRNDLAGCVAQCSEDTSSGLGATKVPSYHTTATLQQCVTNCSAVDFLWALAITADKCVLISGDATCVVVLKDGTCAAACPDYQYANADKYCIDNYLFGEDFRNCKTGTVAGAVFTCTVCKDGYYLKKFTAAQGDAGCIKDCSLEGNYLNIAESECFTDCSAETGKIVHQTEKKCIAACDTGYVPIFATPISNCKKCSELTFGGCMTLCKLCSLISGITSETSDDASAGKYECTECYSGYLFADQATYPGCAASCSAVTHGSTSNFIDDISFTPLKCSLDSACAVIKAIDGSICLSDCSQDPTQPSVKEIGTAVAGSCVAACADTEYYDASHNCVSCSADIANCKTCLNNTYCLECAASFNLAPDSSSCDSACAAGTVLTVGNDPNLSTPAKVCVTSPCHENDYTSATSYLKAGTTNECIAACVADTEYLDDNYECKLCSDTITGCTKCVRNASNVVVCTLCATDYIKIGGQACVANCSQDTAGTYGFANYSTDGIKKCIQSCNLINGYVSKLVEGNCVVDCLIDAVTNAATAANRHAADGISCIDGCVEGEYDNTTHCKLCTSLGGYYENCTKCTYGTQVTCDECIAGYFIRYNGEGCIRDCQADQSGTGLYYGNAAFSPFAKCRTKTECISTDSKKITTSKTCDVACTGTVEYELSTDAGVCHKASEIHELCIKCAAAAAECEKCQTGHYVSLDKSKCVKSCKDEDSGNVIQDDGITCGASSSCSKYPNANATKCIASNCSDEEQTYLNLAGDACVTTCPSDECPNAANQCVACSATTNCIKCHFDGAVKCDQCASGHWLGLDFSCTSGACAAGLIYANPTDYICITSCNEKGQYLKQGSTTECVASCAADEYSDWASAGNLNCTLCSTTIHNCDKCTVQTVGATTSLVCDVCAATFHLKSDHSACGSHCKDIGEYKYTNYTNNNTKLYTCVTACSTISADLSIYVDASEQSCVYECPGNSTSPFGQYSASGTKLCTQCPTPCETCTEIKCLTCQNSNYMNVDKATCSADCPSGSYPSRNTSYLHCVSDCVAEDNAYLNEDGDACVEIGDTGCTNVLNYEQTQCAATCTADVQAVDDKKVCRLCNYFIPYCTQCSSNTTCTLCSAGTTLNSAGECVEFCPSGEYLAEVDSTYCVSTNCDSNSHVATNDHISSSETICVAACGTDEYATTGPNKCNKCASSNTYSDGTTADAMSMAFCKTCTAANVCTECLVGYLWTDSTNTACIKSCSNLASQAYVSIATPKTCLTACDGGSFKLSMADEGTGTLHLKCVMNCWTSDRQFLSQDGSICVNQCAEHTNVLATAEYPDFFTDGAVPQCELCNSKDANCMDCFYDYQNGAPTVAGQDGWRCLKCAGGKYLAVDQKSCVDDCYANDNSHYPIFKLPTNTDEANFKCIANCFDDNENFARDTTGSGGWECVQECDSTEFIRDTSSIPKYVCTLCSARKDDTGGNLDADDPYFENCNKCSDVDTCTGCSSGFLRYNNKGCVLSCDEDPDYAVTKSYEKSDGSKCVTSCKDDDDGKAIDLTNQTCVASCAAEAFMDTSGTDNQCKLCEDQTDMEHCTTCTSATVCTSCETSYYVRVSKLGCVASCSADDSSFAESVILFNCVSACGATEYSNAGVCEACDTSPTQTDCTKCTSSTNCLECQNNKYATAFPGVNAGCQTDCATDGSHLENLAVPKKCVQSCNSGEFANNQNKCQYCYEVMPDCLQCTGMYQCTSCDTNSLNKYRSSDSKSCVAQCGDYATLDSTGTFCEACSVNIASCLACTLEGTTVKCQKCNYGYLNINFTCSETCISPYIKLTSELNNNAGNICTQSCPTGTIYVKTSNACERCHSYCNTCSEVNDETKCIDCIGTMYKNGNYCVKCPEGYHWDDDLKECVVACKDRYYKNNETRTCDPCHQNCLTCNGPKYDQCTSCSGLVLLSGICAEYNQEMCPSGQFLLYSVSSTNCVDTCPVGMYADTNSQTCENCDTTCATCSAGNPYSCLSCESPRIYNEVAKTCVLECPEGTYKTTKTDSTLEVCSICNTGCKRCANNADNCQSCEIGYYLYEDNCITTCKDGYYAKTNPRECALCDESCLTCIAGFTYACLTCNSTAKLILITELDKDYGTCKNQSDVFDSIESESNNFNEDNYVTSYSVASQANVIRDALVTANESNSTIGTAAQKAVSQFTALASKRSANIETTDDALYLVGSISELNNVTGISSEESLSNSIETLNNVIENDNVAMDKSLFGKMVSSWSNVHSRNEEIIDSTTSNREEKKKKEKEFNAKLTQYNEVMIDSLKIAMLGSSEEQAEFTTKANGMSAKIKKINNKVAQKMNLDITREELTRRILAVRRALEDCQEVTNIGQPLVTLDQGCIEQLPAQTLLMQFVNYKMNVFSKYTYASDIKSNVILYDIIDGSTQKSTTIEGAKDGYLTIDIPLQELICDSDDNELVCVRWDDQIKDWSDEGVETISDTDLYVQCRTRKLGYFAIIEREKFSINRKVRNNYGFMSVWFILILAIVLLIMGIAMSIGDQKQQPIDQSNFSDFEEMQYQQGKVRKIKESHLPLTINPILSLFLSVTMSDFIKKIVQLSCYIMAFMFYLSIFYNIYDWNISDDEYLMVPLPLLSIFLTWVCNYVLGTIRAKLEESKQAQGLYIYYVFAFLYYAGMSVGISLEMKSSTDDRSHKFAYTALLGLAIDILFFDTILILLAKSLKLHKKMVWNFFIMGGFAEEEFTKISGNAKAIMSEDNQKLTEQQPQEFNQNMQPVEQQENQMQQDQDQQQIFDQDNKAEEQEADQVQAFVDGNYNQEQEQQQQQQVENDQPEVEA